MKKLISFAITLCMLISMCVVTAFAESDVATVTSNGSTTNYSSLSAALNAANSGDIVTLIADDTLSVTSTVNSGVTLDIASGTTLIIPYAGTFTNVTTGDNTVGGISDGSAYVTLIIANGATVNVYGRLVVCGNQQSTQPQTGCLTGDYGKIDLSGNLYVKNGGVFYARGEISGVGTMTAESGSSVYQLLQIQDWRGGTATQAAANENVFPFNLYDIKNITANAVYENGATLFGQFYVSVTINLGFFSFPVSVYDDVVLIGSGGMFYYTGTAGSITTSFSSGTMNATINGNLVSGSMVISASQYGYSLTIDSSSMVLPFGYNVNAEIESGSVTISNDVKLLPGCELLVDSGASLVIDSNAALYLYNGSDYDASYNFAGWSNSSSDAQVTGSGTVTVNGTFAESTDVTSTLNVKEFVQSTNSTVNVPFVAIITIV